jgi:PHP family Zn ribbon phosphoesterase
MLIPGNIDSYTAVTGSDSHYPDDFGSAYSEIECDEISIESIRQSLREGKVRRVIRGAGTFSGHYFKQHL